MDKIQFANKYREINSHSNKHKIQLNEVVTENQRREWMNVCRNIQRRWVVANWNKTWIKTEKLKNFIKTTWIINSIFSTRFNFRQTDILQTYLIWKFFGENMSRILKIVMHKFK